VLDRLQSHGSCHPLKATAFSQDVEFFLFPVGSIPAWVTCSLRSTGITPFRHYYGLLPEHGGNSGFGVVVDPFDASSEVSLHSSLLFPLDMIGLHAF
jgi:hypothetical protein